MGGTIILTCTQTPDKIGNGAWKVPRGIVTDLVTIPYYHDPDASLCKELGVVIEKNPSRATAFAGSPARNKLYPAGMGQPGCVVISADNGKRLFEWFHPATYHPKGGAKDDPSKTRGNGAVGRALPEDVITIVKEKLEGKAPTITEARIDGQEKVKKKTLVLIKAMRKARKAANAKKAAKAKKPAKAKI